MTRNHLDALERSHDGAIPEAALAAARAADAAEPAPPAAPPPPQQRFRSVPQLVAAMARIMVERMTGAGACSEADLQAAGFSAAEISAYGNDAQVLAARLTADRTHRRRR